VDGAVEDHGSSHSSREEVDAERKRRYRFGWFGSREVGRRGGEEKVGLGRWAARAGGDGLRPRGEEMD
jgi:hypothetical protein